MTVRATHLSRISEAHLQDAVIQLATLHGWLVMHTRPGRTGAGAWTTPIQGDPGFPDLVFARRGTVLFVELKSDRGRLTRDQEAWAAALQTSIVWRPADWIDGTIGKALT